MQNASLGKVRITEKKLNNKSFRNTEDKILRLFFAKHMLISIKELAMKIGIARSTVYRHHRSLERIIPDYEIFLMQKYRRAMRKVSAQAGKSAGMRMDSRVGSRVGTTRMSARASLRANTDMVFLKMLTFIIQHRELYGIVTRDGRTEIFARMVEAIRGVAMGKICGVGGNDKTTKSGTANRSSSTIDADKLFQIYTAEVAQILALWQQSDFDKDKLDDALRDIKFLTNTAMERLGPVVRVR